MKKYLITYRKKENSFENLETVITDLSPGDWLEKQNEEISRVSRYGGTYWGSRPAILYIKELPPETKTTEERDKERYSKIAETYLPKK